MPAESFEMFFMDLYGMSMVCLVCAMALLVEHPRLWQQLGAERPAVCCQKMGDEWASLKTAKPFQREIFD